MHLKKNCLPHKGGKKVRGMASGTLSILKAVWRVWKLTSDEIEETFELQCIYKKLQKPEQNKI